jgi:enamine deaminase RidA (YjgF/YER057c/UK114 family)
MDRQLISSGTSWEKLYGYSRAVRVGGTVYVAGTTAVDETGQVIGENDPYSQARFIFEKIGKALAEAGASLTDTVRVRTFVTDISRWTDVARAQGEVFGKIRPAATLAQVSALVDPRLLVEIELDAVMPLPR